MAELDSDVIEYLVRHKFPAAPLYGDGNGRFAELLSKFPNRSDANEAYAVEREKFRKTLQSASRADLQVMFKNGQRLKREREATEHEAAHRFNQSPAIATPEIFEHWSKTAYWTTDEAIALILARDPAIVCWRTVYEDKETSQFGQSFLRLHDLASRAVTMHKINYELAPEDFLAWAKQMQIEVPEALEVQVRKHGHRMTDWKAAYNQEVAKVVALEARIAELESKSQRESLGPRERDSLLKLVIGMAINGYAYDYKASRTGTAKEISSDLQLIGLSLDEDTIRKYLNEAKELLSGNETE